MAEEMAEEGEMDMRLVRAVEEDGWHISAVAASDEEQAAPHTTTVHTDGVVAVALAVVERVNVVYTIGLWKSYGQPELVMVGLPLEQLVQVVGDIATDVKKLSGLKANACIADRKLVQGKRERPSSEEPPRKRAKVGGRKDGEVDAKSVACGGGSSEKEAREGCEETASRPFMYRDGERTGRYIENGILEFRSVARDEDLYEMYMTEACEYYEHVEREAKGDSHAGQTFTVFFPAMQVVWPDAAGRYPYEAECSRSVAYTQPFLSRSVAVQEPWPFLHVGPTAGTFVSVSVAEKREAIARAHYDSDGDWHFLSSSEPPKKGEVEQVTCMSLQGVLHLDPSIALLHALPPGRTAVRREGKWVVEEPAAAQSSEPADADV